MATNERALIEQLKHEKKQLAELQQELLSKKASCPINASNQQQVAQLQILRTYQQKAKNEQQLLAQIQKELEHAKAQLDAHHKRAKAPDPKAPPAGSVAAKSTVVLQERLAHQKQQLDKVVARNKAVRDEIDDWSKCGTAAQQLQEKLQRQLAEATAEAVRLQQLTDTVKQVQQEAEALAEQLRLHNDAEQLSMSEAQKQLVMSMQRVQWVRQQKKSLACQDTACRSSNCVTQQDADCEAEVHCSNEWSSCLAGPEQQMRCAPLAGPGSISDEVAVATLQQLLQCLQGPPDAMQHTGVPRQLQSSLSCCSGGTSCCGIVQMQPEGRSGTLLGSAAAASSDTLCGSHSTHQWVVQQVKQLQEAAFLRFKQCSVANVQLAHLCACAFTERLHLG